MLLNLPQLQDEFRLKMDIKAAKTVAMAILTYFVCYIPTIAYAVWRFDEEDNVRPWFAVIGNYGSFISSASNPVIYVFRNRRYRFSIRQLWRDPCGRSIGIDGERSSRMTGEKWRRPVRAGKDEGHRQQNSRGDSKRLEGEELGASTRPRSETTGPSTAKGNMPKPYKVFRIAWRGSTSYSDNSLAELMAKVYPFGRLKTKDVVLHNDQDFALSGLVEMGGKKLEELKKKKRENGYDHLLENDLLL